MEEEYDTHGYPKRRVAQQRILNEHWPADPRSIHDQPKAIPVRVHVVWEGSGEEWIDGRATRWTDTVVFVEFHDSRHRPIGAWVKPEDVERR